MLDDLQLYRRLVELSAEFEALSLQCWSPRSEQLLLQAARLTRLLASEVYRTSLKASE